MLRGRAPPPAHDHSSDNQCRPGRHAAVRSEAQRVLQSPARRQPRRVRLLPQVHQVVRDRADGLEGGHDRRHEFGHVMRHRRARRVNPTVRLELVESRECSLPVHHRVLRKGFRDRLKLAHAARWSLARGQKGPIARNTRLWLVIAHIDDTLADGIEAGVAQEATRLLREQQVRRVVRLGHGREGINQRVDHAAVDAVRTRAILAHVLEDAAHGPAALELEDGRTVAVLGRTHLRRRRRAEGCERGSHGG
mmetsp:Transcript_13351/g.34784  ORF Transcript_13351/g.34784 Transcript_13351/m.34784 type:complete len:250 (-) Transcript_13351:39-788(-)